MSKVVSCRSGNYELPFIEHVSSLPAGSRMFETEQKLFAYRAQHPGEETFLGTAQGDGAATLGGLSVEEINYANTRYYPITNATAYGNPFGHSMVRRAIVENLHGSPAGLTSNHVIMKAGGRHAISSCMNLVRQRTGLFGAYTVLPAVAWISYGPILQAAGLNVIYAPGDKVARYKVTPSALRACAEYARNNERPLVALILTTPDNPTSQSYTEEELEKLIETAVELGLKHVFLDLMYDLVMGEGNKRLDMPSLYLKLSPASRQALIVMGGITKCIGASSVGSAYLMCSDQEFVQALANQASHLGLPNDGQAVALEVFGSRHRDGSYLPPDRHPWVQRIVRAVNESRSSLLSVMGAAGLEFWAENGYYAWLNVSRYLGCRFLVDNQAQSLDSVEAIASHLIANFGVAVVPGSAFMPGHGDKDHWVRVSLANDPGYTHRAAERLRDGLAVLVK